MMGRMYLLLIYLMYVLAAPFVAYYLARRKGLAAFAWATACFLSPIPFLLLIVWLRLPVTLYRWVGVIPSFVPLAILLFLASWPDVARTQEPPKPSTGMKLANAGAGALALAGAFMAFRVVSCCMPHTFLSSYPKAILASRNGGYSSLTDHFPYASTPSAKLTKFNSNPGGFIGAHWVARFECDAPFLDGLRKTYGPVSVNYGMQRDYFWKTFAPHAGFKRDSTEHMDDYELFLLVNVPGNHAKAAGLFVSKTGNDAIFFGGRL